MLPSASNSHILKVCKFEAIYNFGDSISDTDNLIKRNMILFFLSSLWPKLVQSNGLVIIDSLIRDPLNNTSLNKQLNWMYSPFNTTWHNSKDCAKKHRRSLFLIGEIGANDYHYAFFQGKSVNDLKHMVPYVVKAIKDAVTVELLNLMTLEFTVLVHFPIGCIPIYPTGFHSNDYSAYNEFHCLKGLNNFSMYHNEQLQQAIEELQEEHLNETIVYADYYNAYKWILRKAALLGFDPKSLQKAYCGSGGDYDFSLTRMCGAPNVPVCPKPGERIS
ncbi:hypothetical protein GH714_011337 [Hevea brasiliensis]|uniref:SGNH hydrolase-type esterase domain-containing protein n=1 Tax=Hevea brasiliensis TaxID=3981 RepID=A0A6A6MXG6_HEVBR|nr:hypothetical protein GH714_011337 [Hevea brasiliensis]